MPQCNPFSEVWLKECDKSAMARMPPNPSVPHLALATSQDHCNKIRCILHASASSLSLTLAKQSAEIMPAEVIEHGTHPHPEMLLSRPCILMQVQCQPQDHLVACVTCTITLADCLAIFLSPSLSLSFHGLAMLALHVSSSMLLSQG